MMLEIEVLISEKAYQIMAINLTIEGESSESYDACGGCGGCDVA